MIDWTPFNQVYEGSPVNLDNPHGWIQYKGTDICIDLHCECGHHGHHDGDFFYHYQCPDCGKKWSLDPNVTLLPVNETQAKFIEQHHIEFKTDT